MPTTLIPHTEGRIVPWANGLGTSREIILAQTASQGDSPQLLWRLATTRIASDCSFSLYAEQDRIIVLLKGSGFMLAHKSAKPQVVEACFAAHHFGGDWGTSCRLLGGPVEVLNVMASRDRITCSIEQRTIGAEPVSHRVSSALKAMYVLDGELLARLGDTELALQAGDTVRLDNRTPHAMHLQASGSSSRLLFLEAQPKPLPPEQSEAIGRDGGDSV